MNSDGHPGRLFLLLLLAAALPGCIRVPITEAHQGLVVDAETGAPLPDVSVLVRVMRVSSFDGVSEFKRYSYQTGPQGEFVLPRRKRFVHAVEEGVEEIQYFAILRFTKPGYASRDYRTDDDSSPFAPTRESRDPVVVKLRKVETTDPR